MRLDGACDRFARSWCAEGDPAAGIGVKYGMRFELAPTEAPPISWPCTSFDWLPRHSYHGHEYLISAWPHTPVFVNTLRRAIIAWVERARTSYSGDSWPGYPALAALAQSFPTCAGAPFEWLTEERRAPFRSSFKSFQQQFELLAKGASRVWGATPVALLEETALFCVSQGFAEGVFDETTDDGRLQVAQEHIAQNWKTWSWPHQLLGAGIAVHDSVYDHIDDALLLQIAGADAALAGASSDCVLQVWVPTADLRRGDFARAAATLELS